MKKKITNAALFALGFASFLVLCSDINTATAAGSVIITAGALVVLAACVLVSKKTAPQLWGNNRA